MSLLKSSVTIAGFTLLSRIFGFIRDVLFASVVGTGLMADAFFVAFRFPNMFRALFAEGAMNAVFVPIFSQLLCDKKSAIQFVQSLGVLIFGFMVCFVTIGVVLMPQIMTVQASGYVNDTEKFALTVTLAQIMFPYLLFMVMTAFFAGILNSFYHFALPAFTPCILNIVAIGILGLVYVDILPLSGYELAIGVIVAGILQASILLLGCIRYGVLPFTLCVRISPKIKQFFRQVLPVVFGASVLQLNILIGTIIATTLQPGSVSFLYYADRLVQLPLGVIGIAIGVALIPMLSKAIGDNDAKKSHTVQAQAIIFALFLTVPSAVALALINIPIISGLFAYGAFGLTDTLHTASALQMFALGLPAFVLVKVLTPAYFARLDTKTPVRIALVCMGINIGLSLIFIHYISFAGLALATSISAWCNVGALITILYMRNIKICYNITMPILKIMGCSVFMGAVLMGLYITFEDIFTHNHPHKIWVLIAFISMGKIAYTTAIFATKTVSMQDIKTAIRR